MNTLRFVTVLLLLAAAAFAGSVNPAWIKHYTGPGQSQLNEAADSYLDTLTGNLYVVGAGELPSNPGGTDLVVMKYRPDGTRAWVNGFSGTGNSSGDMAQAIAVDSAGNIYIAGRADNSDYDDAAWAKYDSNGTELWHRTSGLSSDDEAFDVAIGNSGDIYICGSDSGFGYLTGYLVARIDPSDGDTLWTRTYVLDTTAVTHRNRGRDYHPDYFENYDLYDNVAVAIARSPDSGVVTTGQGLDYNRDLEWWTMKFKPSGDTVWKRTYHNPLTIYDDNDAAFDLAVANNGEIYVVGFDYYETGTAAQGYNYAVVRYSTTGSRLSYRSLDVASEHGDDYAFSVALDDSSTQNVYVTGTLAYPYPLNEQASTMKFNNLLTSRWGPAGATYGATGDDDRGYSVCYRKGRAYVTGRSANDLFVLGYTEANAANKDTLWSYRYDGADHLTDFGATICASDSDHVYVSGEVSHSGGTWASIYTARLRYGHPEMAVTSIVSPQGTFDHYDSVIPQATIKNNGDVIPMVNAFMYIGLPYGDTIQVYDGPAPGQSAVISFRPWSAHPTGLVQVRCSIEVDGDTVPSNDFTTDTVQVIPIDVGCLQIIAPADSVDSGGTVTPAARFKNFGTTTQTFPVWFRVETTTNLQLLPFGVPPRQAKTGRLVTAYEAADTVTLAAQATADVSFRPWTVASPPGTYRMKAFTPLLDDGPANDTVRAQLVVRRPRHDVGASAILAPADSVDSGTVVTPRAVITNFGGARDSFRIRFTIGTFFASETVMVLTSGRSDTADFAQWTAIQVGTHTARCSTMLVGDSSAANNSFQKQVVVKPPPGIESPADISGIPREFSLGSPRPNPSAGRMLVPFALPVRIHVSIQVYDAAGALVRTLAAAELPPGFHHARWDGTDERGLRAKPGTYFCRLHAADYSRIVKLVMSY